MKNMLFGFFALALAMQAIEPRLPIPKAPPSTAVSRTSGGLIAGLDGGTYEPYKTALIAKVQGALAKKGFYKGEVNGVFDKETMSAVGAFQKQHGLSVNGMPSPSTRRLLFRD